MTSLAFVRERGVTHPREVEARFGRERAANDWGGQSSATTLLLERLHHYGRLRVADRVAGVRRYAASPPLDGALDPDDRLYALAHASPASWHRPRRRASARRSASWSPGSARPAADRAACPSYASW